MTEKKKDSREFLILGAILLVVILVVWLMIRLMPSGKHEDLNAYFGNPSEEEAAIVLEQGTAEEKARLFDGRLYVPYALVQNSLNSRFFWDESVQELLFTTADALYEIPVDSTSYSTEGETQKADAVIIRRDGEALYVDLAFLQERSDFSFEQFEGPARVVVSEGSLTVQQAVLKKDARIRTDASIKASILKEGQRGDTVTVLEQAEKWTRVRTQDGIFGYLKANALGETQEVKRETVYQGPEYTSLSMEGKVNLIWHGIYYQDANNYLADAIREMKWVNVISPTWYRLSDNEGGVESIASQKYVEEAHKNGLQVWPLIDNFGQSSSLSVVLADFGARKAVQEYLIEEARSLNFDGINIDFEAVAESAGPAYVQFMRELSILCRKEQIYLSVDVPVPMAYSYYYNRKELGAVCDFVIVMGYDEHYAGSESAGPVASMEFERTGIANMLKEVPAEKLVSAIPFYTRLWYTTQYEDGTTDVASEEYNMERAWEIVEENGAEAVWDDAAEQPYAHWNDAEGRLCEIWLEDDSTIAERAAMVSENELAGIAEWVLGMEADYVWKIIAENIQA